MIKVECANPASGPASIEGVYDEALSLEPSLRLINSRRGTFDGLVVACVSDHPLVGAARELLECPVVGIYEAGCLTATLLGDKFSVVTTNARWKPLLEHGAVRLGFASRMASVRTTDTPVLALEGDGAAAVLDRVIDQAKAAVRDDGAEVIVLGCAGMTGLEEALAREVRVPIVDPARSGVELCASLVRQGLRNSKVCLYAPPQQVTQDLLR
eukprot:Hpha_TRINITY_DN34778_c0_g1::TRINITY_DN34778_c0_g1_i1::g.178096::m.178096/K16841/hpxA; allantoin racemase